MVVAREFAIMPGAPPPACLRWNKRRSARPPRPASSGPWRGRPRDAPRPPSRGAASSDRVYYADGLAWNFSGAVVGCETLVRASAGGPRREAARDRAGPRGHPYAPGVGYWQRRLDPDARPAGRIPRRRRGAAQQGARGPRTVAPKRTDGLGSTPASRFYACDKPGPAACRRAARLDSDPLIPLLSGELQPRGT